MQTILLVLGAAVLLVNTGTTMLNQMALEQTDGKMMWDPAVAAATTEAVKLLVAAALLFSTVGRNPSISRSEEMPTDAKFVLRYAAPGLLYALCNVLMYNAVELLGSTNFQLLNNMKIITTAVVYRLVLKRKMRVFQWHALVLLFVAMCTLAMVKAGGDEGEDASKSGGSLFIGSLLMLFISTVSASAGVYNEVLIKGTKANVWWQNVLLYIFTMSFCLLGNFWTAAKGGSGNAALEQRVGGDAAASGGGLFNGFTVMLWSVILCKAFYGQLISLVFKYASNILKVYATSLSVIASAVMCAVLLGDPLSFAHLVAGVLIVLATGLYYSKPETLTMYDSDLVGCGSNDRVLPISSV